jgi:hypothetical protein
MACATLLIGDASIATAQSVSLRFENGRITLTAHHAPLSTILAEWARVGGTQIVNAERVTGAPVTFEFHGAAERQVLETLLRSVAGYVITQRVPSATGASTIGGVVILATSSPPRAQLPVNLSNSAVQPRPQAVFNEPDPNRVTRPVPESSAPGPGIFRGVDPIVEPDPPPPPVQRPQQPPQPTRSLTTLPGSSRPGEITPQPAQQPNQR